MTRISRDWVTRLLKNESQRGTSSWHLSLQCTAPNYVLIANLTENSESGLFTFPSLVGRYLGSGTTRIELRTLWNRNEPSEFQVPDL
jgi:hypothetical protein